MEEIIITASPQVAPIVTGRFAERPAYCALRPHGTRDYLLILTTDGAGRFGHAGGDLITMPGDLVILRPGTRHDYGTAHATNSWSLVWAHFLPRPGWMEWLAAFPDAAPGIAFLRLGGGTESRTNVESALDTMNRYANGGLSRRTEFAMNALEAALLHADANNPSASARARFDERILKAMELLRGEWLAEPLSLDRLARAIGLSPSRFSHLFKEQTGQTPQQFHENERIVRARQLLTLTSRSIAAIAEEIGFASPYYFSLRFKQQTRQSPSDFRRDALSVRSTDSGNVR